LWLGCVAVITASAGCSRDSEKAERPQPAAHAPSVQGRVAAQAKPAARGKTPDAPPAPAWRFSAAARVVAIGDIHGDIDATRSALRLAGAIDQRDRWVGGSLVVVVTGDQLDRGDDEREVMALLEALQRHARNAGGALHVLSGNHEVMNVAGNFDYVSPAGFAGFADVRRSELGELLDSLPRSVRGRAAAFLPGGTGAKLLATWPVVVQVGETLFVHGGVLSTHMRYGIERINAEVSAWMLGKLEKLPSELRSPEAPFWTRRYSLPNLSAQDCAELGRVLASLDVGRMVVGHTPQKQGINSACDGRVWRIDVGMSAHYGSQPAAVLELKGDAVRVIREMGARHESP
jgi:hypothetical protein